MNKFKENIKQPSTWAGLALLAQLFGSHVAPEIIVNSGVAIGSLLAVVLPGN